MKPIRPLKGLDSVVELVPIFQDNYVFIGKKGELSTCFVVDPGDADPVIRFLSDKKLKLETILLTHEHEDHIGGVKQLLTHFPSCQLVGPPTALSYLIEFKSQFRTTDRNKITVCDLDFEILDCPGHSVDHYAYYLVKDNFLFCGDILFGLGCGRIIGGTHREQYDSLKKLMHLPDQTLIFCAHEYTLKNLNFINSHYPKFSDAFKSRFPLNSSKLSTIEQAIKSRLINENSTVPLNLSFEKQFNPFLLANNFEDFQFLRNLRDKY